MKKRGESSKNVKQRGESSKRKYDRQTNHFLTFPAFVEKSFEQILESVKNVARMFKLQKETHPSGKFYHLTEDILKRDMP